MGYAVGSSCVRDPSQAAATFCAQIGGATSAGVLSCQAPSITGQTLTYTLAVDDATAQTTRSVAVVLGECEPLDWTSAEPLVWLAVGALCSLAALKALRARVFRNDEG
jgi:hypothetical protein